MDCWHREIERSQTEDEVVRSTADFLALWSPRELSPVSLGWRPLSMRNADDLERLKKWVIEDLGAGIFTRAGAQPLRELGDYLWHASARIRQIRSHCTA